MRSTPKWAIGLALLLAALLQQPFAWGQVRIRSGAVKNGITHPKALEQRVFQLTNEARRKNGLPTLDPDKTLMTLARTKSDDMIQRHYFSHTDPDGKRIKDRYVEEEAATMGRMVGVGENISVSGKNDYGDTETTARNIVNAFMVSPGHRRNILEPAYTHLGVGVSIKDKEYYVTQSFGKSANKTP